MKNKGLIFGVIATVALMTVVATGITMALLKDKTNTLTNTFELGNVTTEIEETGSGTAKLSRIKNTGENDGYVRVRVTYSNVVGKVAMHLPLLGDISIYIRTSLGIAGLCGFLVVLILLPFLPEVFTSEKDKEEESKKEEK